MRKIDVGLGIILGGFVFLACFWGGVAITAEIQTRRQHDQRCEAFEKAAAHDNQSAFWRHEAFRAYEGQK